MFHYVVVYLGNNKDILKECFMNRETEKMFSIVSFFAFIVTFVLSFMNSAFIPACMLMLSLFTFTICYMIQNDKKILLYILFTVGVLLIIGSLVYTFVRIY